MNLKGFQKKYESDRFYEEAFVYDMYGPVRKLGPLNTVIDLGALAGEFSFWIYDQAEKIYAIEPTKSQYEELVDNVRAFDAPKIHSCRLAISDQARKGHMIDQVRGGQVLSSDATLTPDDVDVITLNMFMQRHKIEHVDVLKVDIEGGEKQTFDSPDFAEIAYKIDYIIGEHVESASGQTLGQYGFTAERYEYGTIFKR